MDLVSMPDNSADPSKHGGPEAGAGLHIFTAYTSSATSLLFCAADVDSRCRWSQAQTTEWLMTNFGKRKVKLAMGWSHLYIYLFTVRQGSTLGYFWNLRNNINSWEGSLDSKNYWRGTNLIRKIRSVSLWRGDTRSGLLKSFIVN